MKKIDQKLISKILRDNIRISTGCTEPAAVALATAVAYRALAKSDIEEINISVDRNVYKNSLAVGIPGTPNLKGIYIAAALGIFCNPDKELNLFSDSSDEKVLLAQELLEKNKVKIEVVDNWTGLSEINIKVKVKGSDNEGEAWIQHKHSNITFIRKNNEILCDKRNVSENHEDSDEIKYLAEMDISDLIYAVENLLEEDKIFINEGIEMNKKVAGIGIEKELGLGIGVRIQRLIKEKKLADNEINQAKSKTAGAADARMSGYSVPVTTSCGSGNQGLVVMLPILAVAEKRGEDRERLIKAVALSHLITAYITCYSGYLSALCGCAIKAGIGATAGITYYLGGDVEKIGMAINNISGNITGMICDGAKAGCSLKVATAAGTAVESALLSLDNISIPSNNGIIAEKPEDTLRNIGIIAKGMIPTDKSIIEIMSAKRKNSK